MLKKIIKIILIVFSVLLIIFAIAFSLVSYYSSKSLSLRNIIYQCKNKDYWLWNAYNNNLLYFCENKDKFRCLNWFDWYNISDNNELYVFFILPQFYWKSEAEINNFLDVDNTKWWSYRLFWHDWKKYYAKNNNDIIKYLKLDYECNLNFYSDKDLSNLWEYDSDIFLKLKTNSVSY